MNIEDSFIQEILNHLGIEALNDMQVQMLETWEQGSNDVVLLSPTGSGKTLAYLLPLAQNVEGGKARDGEVPEAMPRVLIIVPSRELAQQTEGVWRRMGVPQRMASVYGGRPAMEEHRRLREVRPEIVVGTPGRLLDHLTKGNIQTEELQTLVIDEFDKCLELGFQEEMAEVVVRLPEVRRRILLSATESEIIPRFIGLGGREVKTVNCLDAHTTEGRLKQLVVRSPEKDKLDTLLKLLCQSGRGGALVFVGFRESVERVTQFLKKSGLVAEAFHGGMEQQDRERALYKFSNGSAQVLVSTDLAARGLDIADVARVIHYHLPMNKEALVHRNGRTARWESTGESFLIVGPEERVPDYVTEAEEYQLNEALQHEVPRPEWVTLYIGKGKKDKLSKGDIAGFLCKMGGLGREDIGRIDVSAHYAFVAIRRETMGGVLRRIEGQKIKGMKTIIEHAR